MQEEMTGKRDSVRRLKNSPALISSDKKDLRKTMLSEILFHFPMKPVRETGFSLNLHRCWQ